MIQELGGIYFFFLILNLMCNNFVESESLWLSFDFKQNPEVLQIHIPCLNKGCRLLENE